MAQRADELLDELNQILIEMGQVRQGKILVAGLTDKINMTLRLFHSIKDPAGFLDLSNLASTSPAVEGFHDPRGSGILPRNIDMLCQGIDFICATIDYLDVEYGDTCLAKESHILCAKFLASIEQSKADHRYRSFT